MKPHIVLIVEDNSMNQMLMSKLVSRIPNWEPLSFSSPYVALKNLKLVDFDVAIVDFDMPGMNGTELIMQIRAHPRYADQPIIMVTAYCDAATRLAAIQAGAVEFLTKPIEPIEFMARIRSLTQLCEAQRKLRDQAAWLREEVDKATRDMRQREEEIIHRLTLAAGYKDHETMAHTIRMARYSAALAVEMGLSEETCRDVLLAAPMHDIGKVGIRDALLQKQGELTADERQEVERHAEIGNSILAGSSCPLLHMAAEIAGSHHERWDGQGYPNRLQGEAIPLAGRIAAVADVFDALTSARPYKQCWTVEQAYQYVQAEAGSQFDPACVAAFARCREEVEAIMREEDETVCDNELTLDYAMSDDSASMSRPETEPALVATG